VWPAGSRVPPRVRQAPRWHWRATCPVRRGTRRVRGTRALGRFGHRRRGNHRLKPGARSPGPPSGGPGLHILTPALQCPRTNTNFPRNQLQRRALRRQQPRHRSVLECLSVSSQVHPSSPPPGLLFYRGDNYSDAGGVQMARAALRICKTICPYPSWPRARGMSDRSFARISRSETGTTPAAFVENARIDAARRLAEESDLPA
jgi:hypothetical protein